MIGLVINVLAFQAAPRLHSVSGSASATQHALSNIRLAMPWEKDDGPDVESLIGVTDVKVGDGDSAAKGKYVTFDFSSRVVDGDELDKAEGVKFELGKF